MPNCEYAMQKGTLFNRRVKVCTSAATWKHTRVIGDVPKVSLLCAKHAYLTMLKPGVDDMLERL